MIRRWLKGWPFFVSWEPIILYRMLETGWDGSWSLMGILTSRHFITSCEVLPLLSFLGRVFGELRLLGMFPVSFGMLLGIASLRVITWDLRSLILWTSALCHRCGEMVDHLLLHCEKAHQLWSFIFTSFGVSWVMPRTIPYLLFDWWNWLGKHSSNIWNLFLLCLLWCLWKEWNR